MTTVASWPLGDARIERAGVGRWTGLYWGVVDRFREWSAAQSRSEMEEHAARVRVHQEAVAQELEAILDSGPDAEDFADRMSDERPRSAEENLALVRATDPRPTVTEKAARRREDINAGVWRGKRRRGECRYCSQTYWFYPSRQKGHFCSQQCGARFWNLRRQRR